MRVPPLLILALMVVAATASSGAQPQEGFRFTSGVQLVNVTVTVTDNDGRFVSGLRRQDFTVYEDGEVQEVSMFSSDRVPVSLGIVLDASGSMTPDKLTAAKAAVDRLIFDLLGRDDELFFMQFANRARLTQGWTTDRRLIRRAIRNVEAADGTALYDAVAEAIPVAQTARNRKKALLLISDGNDTSSDTRASSLRQMIWESDVLVYALGIDTTGQEGSRTSPPPVSLPPPPQSPFPPRFPFPFPGGRRGIPRVPTFPDRVQGWASSSGDRVNADALRQITDDTGGRTEIVRGLDGLDGATTRLADELTRQYFLGYTTTAAKDGRWHSIRVEVKDASVHVRARRGYVAS